MPLRISLLCVPILLATACDQQGSGEAPAPPTAATPTTPSTPPAPAADVELAAVTPPPTPATTPVPDAEADATDLAAAHRAITQDMLAAIRRNTELFRGMKNEASYRAAQPELQAAAAELEDLGRRAKALGPVPPEQNALTTTELGRLILEASDEMTAELERVNRDPVLSKLIAEDVAKAKAATGE
ncbi:MAG: hypothetical protein AAF333_01380 [Planctomycetota bacterium]